MEQTRRPIECHHRCEATSRVAARLTAVMAALAIAAFALAVAALPQARGSSQVSAADDWVIRSFAATYTIRPDGVIEVTEDIQADFGTLQKHGIFRDIPLKYRYDDSNNRVTKITNIRVDDGVRTWRFQTSSSGVNLRIQIGDPDRFVSGPQRYRISYRLSSALNPFEGHDELYWNITGNEWEVTIEQAMATVSGPSGAMERQTCFQGPTGSTATCQVSGDGSTARFASTVPLPPGSGLTIVAGLRKGAVEIPPLVLEPSSRSTTERVSDFLGLGFLPISGALALGVVAFGFIARQWWVAGRDRWFGASYPLDGAAPQSTRPLFAHEPIVVEYQPPEVQRNGRRLRPAEIGLLLDENADTLDVSATIVDLAVRKFLTIKEVESGGIFGLMKKRDYQLDRLDGPEAELLPYEQRVMTGLFNSKKSVKLSDLKNHFYDDLAKVKDKLYDEVTKDLNLFPRDPDSVRTEYRAIGGALGGLGGGGVYLLGNTFELGIIAVPAVLAGVALFLLAPLMPRRTAHGRLVYRRCLGFRRYIETAETDRQRFAEKSNIFSEYLPYAIVFDCVDKWAKAFEGLEADKSGMNWYTGSRVFAPMHFASTISDFSSSVSSVIVSTPGGSGGSGFGGGGSSGGGGGGGGGGSW